MGGGNDLPDHFAACIKIITQVSSVVRLSDERQDAALMLTLLGVRLIRWKCSLKDTDPQSTIEHIETADLHLRQIRRRLEAAAKLSERSNTDEPADATASATNRSTEVASMIDMLRKLRLGGPPASNTCWALLDEKKTNELLEILKGIIRNLELIPLSIGELRATKAKTDAVDLLKVATLGLDVLKEAASKVDMELYHALSALSSASSHTYRDIDVSVSGNPSVQFGNTYSADWTGARDNRDTGNVYEGIRVRGGNVRLGTSYGGRSVFEWDKL